jgi:V/A-type H+-transporting ATPase subunit I
VLDDAGIRASVVFTEPGGFSEAPIALDSSSWAAPFRWLLSRFGTPARTEVDPTPVLAAVVPLLFGFMFPDVGHGLVLATAGLVLARRSPAGEILLRCGLSAALFGAVFGEFFGIHGLLPAPLPAPLEQPFLVLGLSLAIGAGLLLLGLVFSGIEAVWQGQLPQWALDGAPVLALYLSLLLATVWPIAVVAAGAAVVWYLLGAVVLCGKQGVRCVAGRIGHLLEATLQLAINTLSFLRVGAFALAHSALSLMVVELVSMIDSLVLRALWFVLGQLVIIVLEALVVSVQVTRLVLFEFFIRFLRLEGRPYRPIAKPPGHHAA